MTVYAEASPQQTSSPVTRKSLPRKAMYGLGLGNTLEWYDWQIFGLLAAFIGPQFFAPGDPVSATLSALAVFAVGFAVRPLGGVVLGMVADRIGRRTVMLLSISMMAISTLVIAILPTYVAVGWLAPILLLLARIAQGMSLGGEVSNASAYLAEIAPPNRRGRYSSFFYISTGTAVLLASLLGAFLASTLADDQLASWGWRIPFLIGAALGLVGVWMRRDMAETKQFEKNVAKAKAIKNPLMQTLREHPKSVAQLIGLTLLSTLCYYTFFSALTPFAIRGNGLDDGMVFWALSIATAMFAALQYPFGWTADRFGRKPQLLVWSGAIALLMVPISTLIRHEAGFGSVLLVFCFGIGLYAMKSSIAPAIMSELFPAELRCLGIGTWYNLTVALFGGTAPLVIQWLSNIGHSSWFFWYVSVGAAVAFVTTLTLPEAKGSVLR